MGNLPHANPSPRIVNGVLKWYLGDTFEIQINLDLEDQDGEKIIINNESTVEVVFLDCRRKVIKEFVFSGIEDNVITLSFDNAVSTLFPIGEYTYDIYYRVGNRRVTLADNNRVVVE